MTGTNSSDSDTTDDGGFEGPDVEKSVHDHPVIDRGHDELNDSADSYASPARSEDHDSAADAGAESSEEGAAAMKDADEAEL